MKILIVEDEKSLSNSIAGYLSDSQYTCEVAYDYNKALEKALDYDYDCILLDISLPGGNGLNLLKILKDSEKMDGVIIVSAKNSIEDKIKGLEIGADDYITKPFHLAELKARVDAIVRRKFFDGKNTLQFEEIVLDLPSRTAKVGDKLLDLTPKEYELLIYFISNKNKVISKSGLVDHLWGDEMDMTDNYDFLYTHIKNLRKKMTAAGASDYIKSIYGMGYKFSL
ncbi:MAG: DNA-binding response regulator [Pseudopedobacter saltans]|uniref:DNA-binding response regulator n=1 Tax=Pseudopedobacter saltans TaxID=151895 RepID=A0A2W5HAK4_9SPHI|nr:MAG: DNA-binding response regulator [Pseudopedobacter saltans]